ncbi:MAG: alkaline phosphatase family protein [Aliidongia sp.]
MADLSGAAASGRHHLEDLSGYRHRADPETGEGFTDNPFIGNYGDIRSSISCNTRMAQPGSPLFQNALTGTDLFNNGAFNGGSLFAPLQNDVKNNTLPQVSWIVAPQAYCEHPSYPSNWGAWYVLVECAGCADRQSGRLGLDRADRKFRRE